MGPKNANFATAHVRHSVTPHQQPKSEWLIVFCFCTRISLKEALFSADMGGFNAEFSENSRAPGFKYLKQDG